MLHLFNGSHKTRIASLVAAVILLGMLGSTERSEADICVSGNPAIGSCAQTLRTYPGEFPYAMTVIGSENRLLVADLFSGQFFKFDVADITAPASPAPFFSPLGPSTYTGVAWHNSENRLYWLIEGGGGPRIALSGLSGNLEGATYNLTPPTGAFLSGLTFKPDTGTFWTGDIVNDQYLELELNLDMVTGALISIDFTGASFPSPGLTQFGGDAYGLGVTAVAQDVTQSAFLLDVAVGSPHDLRTARLERVIPATGERFGIYYELSSTNELPGWITGLAWSATGSGTGPSTFFADLTSNQIVEVPTPFLNARSIVGLTCAANASNDVNLSWTNPIPYTSISVLRDGQVVASISGTETSYTDPDLEGGTYHYAIDPVVPSGADLPPATCDVVVGFGRFLNAAPHSGTDAFAITVIESTDQVLVADLTGGTAHLYGKDLVDSAQTVPSPFGTTDITAGVAWNSTDNTLLWHNGSGQIQKTDLAGGLIGGPAMLTPLPLEPNADISYAAANGTYIGVSVTGHEYFEFQEDGTVIDNCPFPTVNGALGLYSQGIAVVGDPSSLILDAPIGPSNGVSVDRVRRLLDCTDTGLEYSTTPSTLSGVIAGIAWTDAGSSGLVAEYMVGFDTGTIYEVSLDLSSVGDDFQRGDVNVDGVRDISDATTLLIALFGAGTAITCIDGADANDNGTIDIADAITLLDYLFVGGVTIAAPFDCGPDVTEDSQSCDSYPICP